MNKSLTLRNAVLFSFFAATLFTACSKSTNDMAANPDANAEVAMDRASVVALTDAPNDGSDDRTFGSVKLTVSPAGNVGQIIIFNDNFSSDEFQFDANTGEYQLNNVPTGSYTVVVVPNNDNYRKANIENIGISENNIFDMGNILLHN